ncbi:hypothetical protein [Streptomyces virginiae]|uniref:CRISPR-associated endonuclease Cas2 n=1 Tax=Streptomyces virginiae TaxID=1961 RepID=UPI003655FC47
MTRMLLPGHMYLCSEGHGIRVQKSVFEIFADDKTLLKLMYDLEDLIDAETDSIRIYRLPHAGTEDVHALGIATAQPHRADLVLWCKAGSEPQARTRHTDHTQAECRICRIVTLVSGGRQTRRSRFSLINRRGGRPPGRSRIATAA